MRFTSCIRYIIFMLMFDCHSLRQDQLSGFLVMIGNHSNPWRANMALPKNNSTRYKYILYAGDTLARFVSVIRQNKFTLTLCEVEVYGECLDGVFSEFCNRTCGHCSNGEPCNKDTGECLSGCEPGWIRLLCNKEVRKDSDNESCKKIMGECPRWCEPGCTGILRAKDSSARVTPTLSREDMTVIGGSFVGVCVGALIISIIIIAVLKQRRNIDTGDPEMEMNETGVIRKKTFGDSETKEIINPSDCNVASLCIPTTTASRDDSEHSVAQITEAEYEKLQDRGRIESSIYCEINTT